MSLELKDVEKKVGIETQGILKTYEDVDVLFYWEEA